MKCLPAHIQLADKMMKRGTRVDIGSRLGYVITVGRGHKSKQYEKLEDPKYQRDHGTIVKIDYLYYLKLSVPPIDQLLSVGCGVDNFLLNQYKYRLKRYDLLESIDELYRGEIKFEN